MPRDSAVTGNPPRPSPARIHSLDALRAVMMLLGLVLHTALSYVPELSSGEWPYQDRQASDGFGWLVSLIHTFRMPAFFAVAGFFAAFLVERRGTGAFLRHRLSRIGVPLAGGWILLFPLTRGRLGLRGVPLRRSVGAGVGGRRVRSDASLVPVPVADPVGSRRSLPVRIPPVLAGGSAPASRRRAEAARPPLGVSRAGRDHRADARADGSLGTGDGRHAAAPAAAAVGPRGLLRLRLVGARPRRELRPPPRPLPGAPRRRPLLPHPLPGGGGAVHRDGACGGALRARCRDGPARRLDVALRPGVPRSVPAAVWTRRARVGATSPTPPTGCTWSTCR